MALNTRLCSGCVWYYWGNGFDWIIPQHGHLTQIPHKRKRYTYDDTTLISQQSAKQSDKNICEITESVNVMAVMT